MVFMINDALDVVVLWSESLNSKETLLFVAFQVFPCWSANVNLRLEYESASMRKLV